MSKTCFSDAEYEAVKRVLDSGWVTMGPETHAFEKEFANYLGSEHAIAVSSGTAALHLSLLALGIGPGDEVILPSLTFVATANAVRYVGAVPVFAEISGLNDWNISVGSIESKIRPATAGVIVVHYAGFPCQMDKIQTLVKGRGLKLIEDAAHAPGAFFNGKALGAWGDAGCFSFYSNKNMTSAEGGMIVTNNEETARQISLLRSHGMTALTWDRHLGHCFSYDVLRTGFNYRIDELRASLGKAQLAKLNKNNRRRRELTRSMRSELNVGLPITFPFSDGMISESGCHIFPILLDDSQKRPAFMEHMKHLGIQTSIHYPPIHKFTSYADFPSEGSQLPVTELVAAGEVTLPLYPSMTDKDLAFVCQAVKQFYSG